MSPRRLVIPILAAIVVVVAISLFLPPIGRGPTGPASSLNPSPRSVTLLLGFRPDVQFAPFYYALREGIYAEAGLEVTIEHSDDVVRLVADGQSEFGVADATDVMIARSAGILVKYVSTLYERFPVAMIGSPDVVPDEPAGLAGLRVGTPGRFGSSWHALLAVLDAGGLTTDDVTIREYPQFNQVEGLLNGDVDIITGFRVNEPLQLGAQGFETELLTVDDVAPLPGPGVIVGDELLSADPEVVSAFVRATASGQAAVIDDPEAGLAAAEAEVPTIAESRDTARAVLLASTELWQGDAGFGFGAIDVTIWQTGYATMRRLGLIDGSVPVQEMIFGEFAGP
jgi:NitT/TauT family transport system substrate-binding protein